MKVFIGSVFYDNGKYWELRLKITNKLKEHHHETWLWEENGEKEQKENKGKHWTQIVSDAIRLHDVIITFYKTDAGDFSYRNEMPFFPTDYEMAESIRHGTSLRLYIIKGKSKDELRGVKTLYTNRITIGSKPIYCSDEMDFINKVLRDIEKLSANRIQTIRRNFIMLPFEELKPDHWFDNLHTILQGQLSCSDYETAFKLLEMHSEIQKYTPKTKAQKILMAECLGDFANIYANRAMYSAAIKSSLKSIRLFLETGEWNKTFGQIQALSGIQNMAGIKLAYWLNAYGYRTINLYKDLASGFRDSKASILRDLKKYDEAIKLFTEEDLEKSPYSAAKYVNLQGLTHKGKNVNKARKTMEDNILPWARNENRDIAYVLRGAALLSIMDGDIFSAKNFLNEAEDLCDKYGTIHTKKGIIQLRQTIIT